MEAVDKDPCQPFHSKAAPGLSGVSQEDPVGALAFSVLHLDSKVWV